MAIYHCSIKVISRSSGRSSVAAAAYRSGQILHNKYDGITHDFTHKGGVRHTEIILPENAPKEYMDREVLWNAVEAVEKNIKAQTAREIEIALPAELDKESQIRLVREYVQENFVKRGMIADIAVHDKNDGNPHAHIMLTMRSLDQQGRWQSKQRKEYIFDEFGNKQYDVKKKTYKCRSVPTNDWDDRANAELWREAWANNCNRFFIDNTLDVSIDHRSYKRQGIDKVPTIHLGAAHRIEVKGARTDRGYINREIKKINEEIRSAVSRPDSKAVVNSRPSKGQRVAGVSKKYYVYQPSTSKINLIQYAQAHTIAKYRRLPRNMQIRNLKNAANTLNFLMENHITTYKGLDEKLTQLKTDIKENQVTMKRLDFEINRISKVLSAVEDCQRTIDIVQKIQSKSGGAREKYKQENESAFIVFQTAIEVLKKNQYPTVPQLGEIQSTYQETVLKRRKLYAQYVADKKSVVNVANAKKNLDLLLQKDDIQIVRDLKKDNLK